MRGREREIVILRSDDGQHWKEHQLEATEDAVQEVLNESFDANELQQLDDLHSTRITRILTNDFPMYFAVVTRVRQEVKLNHSFLKNLSIGTLRWTRRWFNFVFSSSSSSGHFP